MARLFVRNGFDISQFRFGDLAIATVSATSTSVTYTLGNQILTLFGTFTIDNGIAAGGTITRLTVTQAGGLLANLTQANIAFAAFETALSNNQIGALLTSGDQILGTGADDRLQGYAGNDSITAFAGDDTLFGGAGDDTLNGASGDDLMVGGTGSDVYRVDSTGDNVFEFAGGGIDRVETTVSIYFLRSNFENLTNADVGDFQGVGNILDNVVIGNVGADTLNGRDGDDTLRGGNGNDRLIGADGDDMLVGDAGGAEIVNTASAPKPDGVGGTSS